MDMWPLRSSSTRQSRPDSTFPGIGERRYSMSTPAKFTVTINIAGEQIESYWKDDMCMSEPAADNFCGYKLHSVCGGFVNIHKCLAPDKAILVCRLCFLRVTVPLKAIESWSAFEAWSKVQFSNKVRCYDCIHARVCGMKEYDFLHGEGCDFGSVGTYEINSH